MRTRFDSARSTAITALTVLALAAAALLPHGAQALAQDPLIFTAAGGGPNNLPATAANLRFPRSVAVDAQGRIYLPTEDGRLYRIDETGIFTAIAGTGAWGDTGDGGPALDARFRYLWGVAVRPGAIFVSDGYSHRIRRIDLATGVITAAAGSGNRGFCGDGGPATQACLDQPAGLSFDAFGNLYIADWTNYRVRRVDALTGTITTVAGNGARGFQGDDGPATAASLNLPIDVAVDAAGNLFISDSRNHRIRRVDAATGYITTVAGTGTAGSSGDGGPATSAALNDPDGIALDAAGNLFIAEARNHRVRRVDASSGIITTVAGGGSPGAPGDGGPALGSYLYGPNDVAFDPGGNLLILQLLAFRLRRVDIGTGVITTVAGTGWPTFGGDGFSATSARLAGPRSVTSGAQGDMYISDTGNRRVRRVDAITGEILTVACSGGAGFSGDDGPALAARCYPHGAAVDTNGDLFILDVDLFEDLPESNNRIRHVDARTGMITTYAGTGRFGAGGDGGPAAAADLGNPGGLFLDARGDLFIADNWNHKIRVIEAGTTIIRTVAGTGVPGYSGDDGPALAARLALPHGVTGDASGNLYIADTYNQRVRRVDASTGIITTVAGNGIAGDAGDGGPATAASLNLPTAVAIDRTGRLLIADTGNHRIRVVDLSDGSIDALAGDGTADFSGDGGPARAARLVSPTGLVALPDGRVMVADKGNDRIRAIVEDNRPPVAIAGGDTSRECSSPEGGAVTLDGSASWDPDSIPGGAGDIVLYEWVEDPGLAGGRILGAGAILSLTLSLGEHRIGLRVTDRAGATATDEMIVQVVDTTPPVVSTADWPAILWPPNHRMMPVSGRADAADLCGPSEVRLESISSSEPDDAPGMGDGRTLRDIRGAAMGTPDFGFQLRAERDARGPGRTYTAAYTATDGSGNVTRSTVRVLVPRNRRVVTGAARAGGAEPPPGAAQ